jgi:isopenicillin N synthase-like dioxygenase
LTSSLSLFQGLDPKCQSEAFAQAKRFFSQPTEKKLEVDTKLVPKEYVGYHPMETYSRDGRKKKGVSYVQLNRKAGSSS